MPVVTPGPYINRMRHLLALLALAGGTYTAYHPTLDSRFADVQTDAGDTVLNHYLLEHSWRVIADPAYPGTLLSPPFFHPEPLVIGYSENLFGVAPPYWALRLVLPSLAAFQAWMMLMSGFTYAAAVWTLRRAGVDVIPAVLAGYLWAYGLPHVVQLGHHQLIARFWMPPAVAAAWQFATAPGPKPLNRMLLFLFLQLICGVYTGWFLAFGLGVFVPAAVFVCGTGRALRDAVLANRWQVAFILFGWAAAAVTFAVPYAVANRGDVRNYSECVEHVPRVTDWFAGPAGSRWHETLAPLLVRNDPEARLFMGFGFYILVGISAVAGWRHRHTPRGKFVLAALATAAIIVLVSANIWQGASGWWVMRFIPGGLAIRAVSRVFIAVHLFAVPAVAVGLPLALAGKTPWTRQLLSALAAALVIAEQTGTILPRFAQSTFYGRADRVAADFRGADAAYLVPAAADTHPTAELVAMWAGMNANVPVVNGYSGRHPHTYPMNPRLTEDQVRAWLGPTFTGKLAYIHD